MHKVMFAAAALLAGAVGASQIAAAQDVESEILATVLLDAFLGGAAAHGL